MNGSVHGLLDGKHATGCDGQEFSKVGSISPTDRHVPEDHGRLTEVGES